jgi:methyl-accepting chemotaxis protein
MTDEERQRQIDFILDHQAQLTATVGRLAETVDQLAGTVGQLAGTVEQLAGTVDQLTGTVDHLAEKVDRTADGVTALLAIAKIHDREIKETDERLNALINTVERHISEGRNGRG